ncbi:LysR family transcriptional regulator [Methylorubrum populi]|uniref:LysR family transcriptional regulator n=1 Tax=Methylobacterium radiotolerans TaxID=31998 RepID=A0ABU7T857_9HYPH|nr:LysR family transcriptional regulator [Methylobacterium sp. B4]PXW65885.1 DNA-binding transcriptional LysR family regulator [Methylobacterium sp. B4]
MPNSQLLRDMALFVEVARRRSFSQAAATLGMPISSLSRRIATFEQTVGMRLLDRTTRKLSLTSYGEIYFAQATRLVEDAHRAFDDLVAEAKGASGLLKIAAPPDFWLLQHLSSVITEFSADHEHVQVHVELKPSQNDPLGDQFDLAVTAEEPRATSLIMRKVAQVEDGLFAAPAYLETYGWPEAPGDLSDHRVIVPALGTGPTWSLTRRGQTVPVTVNGPMSCNSPSLARSFALAGHGIVATHRLSVAREVAQGRLMPLLREWEMPPTPIYIVTSSRLLPAKSRSFIDFAMKRLPAILAAEDAERKASARKPGLVDRGVGLSKSA